MSDSLLEDERLTTADIARPATSRQARAEAISTDNRPEQPIQLPAATDNPSNGFAASTNPATSAASASAGPLFPDDELHNFRARWDQAQTSFVDEPRKAVEQADNLVASVVKRIAEQFAAERQKLEGRWDQGDNISTEDLRQALRSYRSFFDRLLSF